MINQEMGDVGTFLERQTMGWFASAAESVETNSLWNRPTENEGQTRRKQTLEHECIDVLACTGASGLRKSRQHRK